MVVNNSQAPFRLTVFLNYQNLRFRISIEIPDKNILNLEVNATA